VVAVRLTSARPDSVLPSSQTFTFVASVTAGVLEMRRKLLVAREQCWLSYRRQLAGNVVGQCCVLSAETGMGLEKKDKPNALCHNSI